jgi:hypothetical protein
MGIRPMYAACQLATVLKFVFGLYLVRKKTWVNNIVGGK